MSKFKGKYEQIAESTIVRYQNGGIMTGDLVKVLPNALKHPELKKLGDHVKAAIQSLMNSELNLRVGGVKSIYPASNSFSDGIGAASTDAPAGLWADVVIEEVPGRWSNPVTLPVDVLEVIDTGANLAPIPDALRGKNKVNAKGKKPEYKDVMKNKDVKYDDTHTLANKNTVLDYVGGSAKQPVLKDSVHKNDGDLLAEAYNRVLNAPKSKIYTVCVANVFSENLQNYLSKENFNHIKTIQGHKTFFDVVFSESKESLEALIKKNVMGNDTFLRIMDSDQQIDETA